MKGTMCPVLGLLSFKSSFNRLAKKKGVHLIKHQQLNYDTTNPTQKQS